MKYIFMCDLGKLRLIIVKLLLLKQVHTIFGDSFHMCAISRTVPGSIPGSVTGDFFGGTPRQNHVP